MNDKPQVNKCPPAGIYIHVPFCLRRCRYCDFFSTVKLDLIDDFIAACRKEVKLAACNLAAVDSIYFGGGTPSVLAPSQVEILLDALSVFFNLAPDVEITLEANPGTIDVAGLRDYRLAGINRLNLGVQSFDDHMLEFLGRIHTGRQALEAMESVRRAGFANLGIDLIYGVAGQTPELWEADLFQAVSSRPEHISCYMLTVEGDTEFAALKKQGQGVCLDDDQVAELFELTVVLLEDYGWRQYEISNFARLCDHWSRDFRSRHNSKYWSLQPYLGLGPSAHSFDGRSLRSWNHSSLEKYLACLARGQLPKQGQEVLTARQQLLERIYLGLRTSAGLDLVKLEQDFDDFAPALYQVVEAIIRQGWAKQDQGRLHLNLEGMLRLDGICKYFSSLIQ